VPTTPFAIGEQISVRCSAVKNSAAIVFFEQGVVEGSFVNVSYDLGPVVAGNVDSNGCCSTGYPLTAVRGDTRTFTIPVYDDNMQPFDFTGMTLRVLIEDRTTGTDIQVIDDGDISVTDNIISFTTSTANAITGNSKTMFWELQRVLGATTKVALLSGEYRVTQGAVKD
jgi:hypothetical protein